MCNLVAYSGSVPPNPDKINLLLMMGRDRGEDSTGMVVNSKRYIGFKGVPNISDPVEFVKAKVVDWSSDVSNVVMGHTRKSSSGGLSAAAAHPYEYEYEDGTKLYFMHNGTLHNEYQLRQKFEITYNEHTTDSDLMGLILYRHGLEGFKEALKMYEGFANFIWYWDCDPDILYVWRGGSIRTNPATKVEVLEEERPLFFIRQKGGIYINSTRQPLEAIFDVKNVYTFTLNTIAICKNGKVVKAEPVERKQAVYTPSYSYGYYGGGTGNNAYKGGTTSSRIASNTTTAVATTTALTNPHNLAKGSVYFYAGKYYVKGNPANGIYYFNRKGHFKQLNLLNEPVRKAQLATSKEILYFHIGFWMKDDDSYNTSLKDYAQRRAIGESSVAHYYPAMGLVHPNCVINRGANSWYEGNTFIYGGTSIREENTRFMYFKYKFGPAHDRRLIEEGSLYPDSFGYNKKKLTEDFEDAIVLHKVDPNGIIFECLSYFNDVYKDAHCWTVSELNAYYREFHYYDDEILFDDIETLTVFQYNMYNKASFRTKAELNRHLSNEYACTINIDDHMDDTEGLSALFGKEENRLALQDLIKIK